MNKRILGNGLEVSTVSLGCMGMTHAFGAPSDKNEMTKLLHQAVDMGYIYFDTAECYTGKDKNGIVQYNEELVGNALKPYRDKVVIASKFGVRHSVTGLKMDSRSETIRKSVEGSLKRLNTDYIDLYYQHRIDPKVDPEEVASVMSDLINEGKIRFWGISEANEDYIRRADAVCSVTAIQNRYSMMYRDYDCLFPVLEELNIGYVAFSPLANGILSDAYSKNDKFMDLQDYRTFMPQFRPKAYKQNEELFAMLRKIALEKNVTPAQISLAWMINKHKNLVPIPGTRKFERLKENAGATDIILSEDEVRNIDKQLDSMKMSAVFGGSPIHKK
ncbi:MAG: aldo/keto reductase [Faecalibacterium sp.]|nr:aldo/keto reductase [Ruminococcus sp.]MCM1392977.1 aldo/keto reductase [Ruminococcus sp.]MCM1484671.1 aldo/keto reductase [Faecalibacterium sp.]